MKNFYVIEGPNGAGKSTVIKALEAKLASAHYRPLAIRQPGQTEIGKILRSALLNPEIKPAPQAELFMMLADKIETIESVVKPALADNRTVISDRGWLSTLVYQGIIGGMKDDVARLGARFYNQLGVDAKTFVLLPTEDIIAKRLASRKNENPDRFEGNIRREWLAYQNMAEAIPIHGAQQVYPPDTWRNVEYIRIEDENEPTESIVLRIFEKIEEAMPLTVAGGLLSLLHRVQNGDASCMYAAKLIEKIAEKPPVDDFLNFTRR